MGIKDLLFTWRMKSCGRLDDGDFIIIQAMGFIKGCSGEKLPTTNDITLVKETLAGILEKNELPIVAQGEFSWVIPLIIGQDADVSYIKEHPDDPSRYLDTHGVLTAAKSWADERGLKRPIILAHSLLLPRAVWTARRIFGDVIVPKIKFVPLDKLSAQKKTTSVKVFCFYELIARLVCKLLGYF